jgi:hypothetical protein
MNPDSHNLEETEDLVVIPHFEEGHPYRILFAKAFNSNPLSEALLTVRDAHTVLV